MTSFHCSTPFICKLARAASSSCCDSEKFKHDAILRQQSTLLHCLQTSTMYHNQNAVSYPKGIIYEPLNLMHIQFVACDGYVRLWMPRPKMTITIDHNTNAWYNIIKMKHQSLLLRGIGSWPRFTPPSLLSWRCSFPFLTWWLCVLWTALVNQSCMVIIDPGILQVWWPKGTTVMHGTETTSWKQNLWMKVHIWL